MSNQFEQGHGPSQRQLRVGELVRRALAEAFLRDQIYDDILIGVSINVGEVRMSADLLGTFERTTFNSSSGSR